MVDGCSWMLMDVQGFRKVGLPTSLLSEFDPQIKVSCAQDPGKLH